MFQCEGCGAVLPGRRARKYCSNACQREADRKANLAAWLESGEGFIGTSPGHFIRRYISQEQGGLCAICGGEATWNGRPLVFVIDHIDGNPTNNRRDNLRLICPNCDSQLETFKNRNKGRGRHLRRERYANGDSY